MDRCKREDREPKYSFGVAKQLIFDCCMELLYRTKGMANEDIGNQLFDILDEIDYMSLQEFNIDKILEQLSEYGKYKGILRCEGGDGFENYIPVSIAKQIVKGRGLGGVLGYLEGSSGE